MDRRKGSYSLNTAGTFTGRFTAIEVTTAATVTTLTDSKRNNKDYYIKDTSRSIPAGTILVGRDATQFTTVTISAGAIDIIF